MEQALRLICSLLVDVLVRQERERELEKNGKVDRGLLGWEEDVEIWRGGRVAVRKPENVVEGIDHDEDVELEGSRRQKQRRHWIDWRWPRATCMGSL